LHKQAFFIFFIWGTSGQIHGTEEQAFSIELGVVELGCLQG
jgi:hypothetical protein